MSPTRERLQPWLAGHPAELWGSGYYPIDVARLSTAGTVNLMWNGTTQYNCVVTLKYACKGTPTYTSADLQPQGATRSTDAGNFTY